MARWAAIASGAELATLHSWPRNWLAGPGRSWVLIGPPMLWTLARSRAQEQSLANVTFLESDLSAIAFDQLFDAAIGRCVLCFQPDPAAWLRKITRLVRPGGIVMFHEPDRKQMRSYPPTLTYDTISEWIDETFRRTGMDVMMGVKLYSTFLADEPDPCAPRCSSMSVRALLR
jgi:SAM-dependent methyltransferase